MPASFPGVPGVRLNYATFIENLAPYIRVAEMNYDPLPATAAEKAAGYVVSDTTDPNKDFEFVELQNIGSQTIDLLGAAVHQWHQLHVPQRDAGCRRVYRRLR